MVNASLNSNELSLEALKAGDRVEFAKLVEVFSEPIYRLALRIVNREEDAEDVLQETFIKAMRSIEAFEGRSSLSTWLYRIAVNEALMILRKTGKHYTVSMDQNQYDDEEITEPKEFSDWCCLPEDELLSGEGRNKMDLAIQDLPENLRVVFLLRDIQELSIQETAEALGLSISNVKTRLLRARLKLRESLSVYYRERMEEGKYE